MTIFETLIYLFSIFNHARIVVLMRGSKKTIMNVKDVKSGENKSKVT